VEHYSFYAVFQTPEEYRLVSGGRELGTLPVDNMIAPGMLLIFSGRRWQVLEVHDRDRVILVAPAKAGVPPIFGGDPGNIHDRVIERMFDIFENERRPIFMDTTSLDLLAVARGNFAQLRFAPGRVAQQGDEAFVLATRCGTVKTTTLALALRSYGFTVQVHDGFLEVFGKDETPPLVDTLGALADGASANLFAHSPNLIFEKFHQHLTEELLQADALSARLDPAALASVCREIKEGV
jgi:ATP-dependent Lhr-like helicase